MLNTLSIFEDLSRYLDPKASRKIAEVLGQVYEEVAQAVTKKEFNELKEIVGDLASAQRDLAHAQEKTERPLNRLIGDYHCLREIEGLRSKIGSSDGTLPTERKGQYLRADIYG